MDSGGNDNTQDEPGGTPQSTFGAGAGAGAGASTSNGSGMHVNAADAGATAAALIEQQRTLEFMRRARSVSAKMSKETKKSNKKRAKIRQRASQFGATDATFDSWRDEQLGAIATVAASAVAAGAGVVVCSSEGVGDGGAVNSADGAGAGDGGDTTPVDGTIAGHDSTAVDEELAAQLAAAGLTATAAVGEPRRADKA